MPQLAEVHDNVGSTASKLSVILAARFSCDPPDLAIIPILRLSRHHSTYAGRNQGHSKPAASPFQGAHPLLTQPSLTTRTPEQLTGHPHSKLLHYALSQRNLGCGYPALHVVVILQPKPFHGA